MPELTYGDSIREALREELKRDPNVFLMGEEIGVFGGAYKVTRGLLDEFGPERVRDTPISEIAIVGAGIGAALAGLRPIVEIMYMDFLTISLDQIGTQLAKLRFMSGGQLQAPMVIRTQYSLGRAHGSQHSQFFPSLFFQLPGVKVVLPSTPADAKGLLKSSVRDGNPVIFVESGVLYRTRGEVPAEEYLTPIGKADVKRKGEDVTIVAISRTVLEALKAAEKMEAKGVSAEIIDPRSIQPLDLDTIIQSVKKTGRLVIVGDDVKQGGVGAEISAAVQEEAFDFLDAPIQRVGCPPIPVPFSPDLEKAYMPDDEKIIQAAQSLMR
jgi:acetoin:2,6-dichlorophenolindophenol oxidoreductase subunit beta